MKKSLQIFKQRAIIPIIQKTPTENIEKNKGVLSLGGEQLPNERVPFCMLGGEWRNRAVVYKLKIGFTCIA